MKKNAITPEKLTTNSPFSLMRNVEGVNEIPPLGCLPLWGREGVTLIGSYNYQKKG
jgi:hypothetical protein